MRKAYASGAYILLLVTPLILSISSCSVARKESPYVVASWYGSEFHGRPTSSGETFDMYKLTCAHREYPFGTRLKVTNVTNGKTVECVVNDRGPFVAGRDLDLSYAAAKKIGLIGPGTGSVLIESTGRDDAYIGKVALTVKGGSGPFAVQVGSFSEQTNASRLQAALSLSRDDVYIRKAVLHGTALYRVRVGDFSDLDSAVAAADRLSREGYSVIVVTAD